MRRKPLFRDVNAMVVNMKTGFVAERKDAEGVMENE